MMTPTTNGCAECEDSGVRMVLAQVLTICGERVCKWVQTPCRACRLLTPNQATILALFAEHGPLRVRDMGAMQQLADNVVPALAMRGLLTLVETARQSSQCVYAITESGRAALARQS